MEQYGTLLRVVCDFINGWEDNTAPFLPESGDGGMPGDAAAGKNLPYGTVAALSEKAVRHTYVDGTCRMELPFAVTLRVDGNAPDRCTAALDWFGRLTRYLETLAPDPDGSFPGGCRLTEVPAMVRKLPDGTAVYRAVYRVGMRTFGV